MKPPESELRRLYLDEALGTRAIGASYGVSKTQVLRWLQHYEVPRRPVGRGLDNRGIEPPTRDELHRMVWEEHLPYPRIAEKYGVDQSAVPHWLRKHSIPTPTIWETRRKGITPEPFNPIDVTTRYAAGQSMTQIAAEYGVSATPLVKWMKDNGMSVRPGGWKQGKRYSCKDGHLARSVYEQRLDDWLTDHGISHDCEPRYPWDKRYRADFLVGDTFIEVWGVTGSERYERRKAHKIEQCEQHGLKLIHINHWQFAKGRQFWRPLRHLVGSPKDLAS